MYGHCPPGQKREPLYLKEVAIGGGSTVQFKFRKKCQAKLLQAQTFPSFKVIRLLVNGTSEIKLNGLWKVYRYQKEGSSLNLRIYTGKVEDPS